MTQQSLPRPRFIQEIEELLPLDWSETAEALSRTSGLISPKHRFRFASAMNAARAPPPSQQTHEKIGLVHIRQYS